MQASCGDGCGVCDALNLPGVVAPAGYFAVFVERAIPGDRYGLIGGRCVFCKNR